MHKNKNKKIIFFKDLRPIYQVSAKMDGNNYGNVLKHMIGHLD